MELRGERAREGGIYREKMEDIGGNEKWEFPLRGIKEAGGWWPTFLSRKKAQTLVSSLQYKPN